MKRIIAVLLAMIMTIGLIPAGFAADPTAGETLKSFGLLTGDTYGNLNENQYLTRSEMMVILARMLGEYDQSFSFTRKSTFTDGNNHWAERYVAYAQYRGWTAGIGNNKFGYNDRHTVREASVFMLKALGYIADVDFTWNTAYTRAVQLGLFSSTSLRADDDILRGDLFKMMLQTLYTKVKGLDITLGQVLKVLPPTSTVFEVKTVRATSLKEILVTFSKPLDKSTVSNSDFTISGQTLTAQVLADGFTVSLIPTNSLSNLSQYALTIDNIRAADGTNLTRTTMNFIAADTEAPRVISVAPASSSSIELTFSEPIMTTGTVTVNSPNFALGVSSMSGTGTSKILVQLNGNMTNGVTYAITARDFKDHVNNYSVYFSGSMVYQPDLSGATAKVLFANQAAVAFEFTKPIKGFTNNHIYHTYAAWTPIGIYKDEAMTIPVGISEAVSKIYVRFAMKSGSTIVGNQLPSGAVNVTISEYNSSGQRLLDSWGVPFQGGTYRVNVVADTTKPTVTKLDAASSTLLTLEFSESVKFSLANVNIQYSTGATIPNLWLAVSGSGKTYTIQMNGVDLTGKSIRVNIVNVEDEALLPNVLTSYSKTLTIPDLVAPYVTEVVQESNMKYVYVTFSEPVNTASTSTAGSATNRSNYTIYYGNSSFVLSRNPVNHSAATVIRLSLTDTEYALAMTSGAQLMISGVRDLAGNTMNSQIYRFSNMLDVYANAPQLLSVTATDRRNITAEFTQALTRVDSGALKVTIGNNVYSVSNLTFAAAGGKTVVTFRAGADLPYDLADTRLVIDTTGTSKIQNIYGINVLNTSMLMTDKIAPAIAKVGSGTTLRDDIRIETIGEGEAEVTTITITFTEAIKVMNYPLSTFTVSRATVTGIAVDQNKVILTINPADNMADTPTLTMNSSVQDVAGNAFRATTSLSTYR